MTIRKATIDELDDIAILFNDYRIFYNQDDDIEGAKAFLLQQFKMKDSTIFIAFIDQQCIGFTQLYNLFSSVAMQPMYLLNDLYVSYNFRGKGVGEALINKAKELAKVENQKGIAIQTAYDNRAQELYKRLGFEPDSDLHFFWTTT